MLSAIFCNRIMSEIEFQGGKPFIHSFRLRIKWKRTRQSSLLIILYFIFCQFDLALIFMIVSKTTFVSVRMNRKCPWTPFYLFSSCSLLLQEKCCRKNVALRIVAFWSESILIEIVWFPFWVEFPSCDPTVFFFMIFKPLDQWTEINQHWFRFEFLCSKHFK